jgi:hypothetical protein
MDRTVCHLLAVLVLLTAAVGTATSAVAAQLVFVSSDVHTGKLGGLAGGDAICNGLAQAAGLPGMWVAWLSNAGINAGDRISGNGPFVRIDRVQIAADRSALLSGTLEAPIEITETGALDGIAEDVWTGTDANGNRSGFTCQGWNTDSSMVTGTAGQLDFSDTSWTAGGQNPCSNSQHIYCFQQPLPLAPAPPLGPMGNAALHHAAIHGGHADLRRRAEG